MQLLLLFLLFAVFYHHFLFYQLWLKFWKKNSTSLTNLPPPPFHLLPKTNALHLQFWIVSNCYCSVTQCIFFSARFLLLKLIFNMQYNATFSIQGITWSLHKIASNFLPFSRALCNLNSCFCRKIAKFFQYRFIVLL